MSHSLLAPPRTLKESFLSEDPDFAVMPYRHIPRYFVNYGLIGSGALPNDQGNPQSVSCFVLYVFDRRWKIGNPTLWDPYDHDEVIGGLERKTLSVYGVLHITDHPDLKQSLAFLRKVQEGKEYEEMMKFVQTHQELVQSLRHSFKKKFTR